MFPKACSYIPWGFQYPSMIGQILTHFVLDIYSLNKSRIPPHPADAFCRCLSLEVTMRWEGLFLWISPSKKIKGKIDEFIVKLGIPCHNWNSCTWSLIRMKFSFIFISMPHALIAHWAISLNRVEDSSPGPTLRCKMQVHWLYFLKEYSDIEP